MAQPNRSLSVQHQLSLTPLTVCAKDTAPKKHVDRAICPPHLETDLRRNAQLELAQHRALAAAAGGLVCLTKRHM